MIGKRGGSHVYCPQHDGDFTQWKLKWDQTDYEKVEENRDDDDDDYRPTMVPLATITSSMTSSQQQQLNMTSSVAPPPSPAISPNDVV